MKHSRNRFCQQLLACLLLLSGPGNACADYYLKLSHDHRTFELGRYSDRGLGMKKLLVVPSSQLMPEMLKDVFQLSPGSEELLVYLHCWLGNERLFHRATLSALKECDEPNPKRKKTISILWQSKLAGYAYNWEQAPEAGRTLALPFAWLSILSGANMNVFCHSMGNRLLEGIIQGIQEAPGKPVLRMKELLLAAPDLDTDIFDRTFSQLPFMAQRIHVFRHSGDRLLALSELRLGRPRLGRSGPEKKVTQFRNIYLVDASTTTSWKNPDVSNHVYFFKNASVKAYITTVLDHAPLHPGPGNRTILDE